MSKGYNSKKSAKAYTSCCYSTSNVKIHDSNLNPNGSGGSGYLLSPTDVTIDTKNYYFEKFHEDNYLLTSIRYTLRVCVPNQTQLPGLFVRLELVDDRTDQEVTCVKRERAGKRVLKGKTKEEFDLSKHGNLKAKLDFRFRETSSDNIVEWFRLNVHLMVDNQKLLTFTSEPFRTSVRSPTKKTTRHQPPPLNPTIVQMGSGSVGGGMGGSHNSASRRSLDDEDVDEEVLDEDADSDSGVDEDESIGEYSSPPPPQQKKLKSSSFAPPPPSSSSTPLYLNPPISSSPYNAAAQQYPPSLPPMPPTNNGFPFYPPYGGPPPPPHQQQQYQQPPPSSSSNKR